MKNVNLGGLYLNVRASGVDEALEKLDRLNLLLKEANSLISELAQHEVNVSFNPVEQEQEDS